MNKKRISALLAAGLISTSALAFAADTTSSSTRSTTPPSSTSQTTERPQRTLTAAEQAERDQKRAAFEAAKTKWDALSAAQKNQVYAIEEKIVALEKEQLDKLVELGVIDKATADSKKADLDSKLASLKSNGSMPFGKGGKGGKPTGAGSSSTTSSGKSKSSTGSAS